MTRIETVALDMAGTTVTDGGLVLSAFERAWDEVRPDATAHEREAAIRHVVDTMGQSKIEVFRGLVDEEAAQTMNEAFERSIEALIRGGAVTPIEGAEAAIRQLKADGRSVVLTTGFARPTAEAILEALGWRLLPDALITPAEAGRGRPFPGMNLLAVVQTGASSVAALAVAGDTPSDAAAGVRAGAGVVVAVLTGNHADEDALRTAGASHIIASVAELPALLNAHDNR